MSMNDDIIKQKIQLYCFFYRRHKKIGVMPFSIDKFSLFQKDWG